MNKQTAWKSSAQQALLMRTLEYFHIMIPLAMILVSKCSSAQRVCKQNRGWTVKSDPCLLCPPHQCINHLQMFVDTLLGLRPGLGLPAWTLRCKRQGSCLLPCFN